MPTYQTIYLLKVDDTHFPQTPRDDNDKDECTQKDKYKDKDARNSSVQVFMYIGCNALWLISFVHQYKDKDKVLKRPNMCYFFEKPKVQGWLYLEHVWWCLGHVRWCLMHVWWCLVVSDACPVMSGGVLWCLVVSDACLVVSGSCMVVSGSCLVVSGDVCWCLVHVWWCLMVSGACLVVSGGVWCMSSGVLPDACLVTSGGVFTMSGGVW